MRYQLFKTFLLVLLVVSALLGMFYMPRFRVGDTLLRRVNLLSDVQQRDSRGHIVAETLADSAEGIVVPELDASAVEVAEMQFRDSVPEGMIAIEDFADVDGVDREMDRFYAALDQAQERPVRIAYFGDSFIEGDILTADLRNLLQERYGGCGVGWMDIATATEGFRQTILHWKKGWIEHNANDSRGMGFNCDLQGVSGHYYLPDSMGQIILTGQKRVYPERLDTAEIATVFYTNDNDLHISVSINNGPIESLQVQQDTLVCAETLPGPIGRIALTAAGQGRLFGIALDGHRGIVLDNFAMRSSNGWFIKDIPEATLKRFAELRDYDLIVVHYGLNVASKGVTDYEYYNRRMSVSLQHLRACFPRASILIVSVSDRDQRGSDGEMHTLDGIRELVQYQRRMASDNQMAFWNLYEAMGGDGSIARMKEEKEANLDFTHINFAGGRKLARIFFDVLMNGKENYNRRTSAQQPSH